MPHFPTAESLRRFFRTDPRERVPLAELASLLGVSRDAAREILREEGAHPADDRISWSDAATLLFDAWPRTLILDALGPGLGRRVIPALFRPAPVQWRIPIFVIRAMEHQAASAQVPRIEDYVADVLYNAIEPSTVAALGDDPSFLRAFHYPMSD